MSATDLSNNIVAARIHRRYSVVVVAHLREKFTVDIERRQATAARCHKRVARRHRPTGLQIIAAAAAALTQPRPTDRRARALAPTTGDTLTAGQRHRHRDQRPSTTRCLPTAKKLATS